nr:MAG TPA: hypothetical protein [Caudoviricetes sp.]
MIYYYLRGSFVYIALCYRPYDLWRGCRGLFYLIVFNRHQMKRFQVIHLCLLL